MEEFLIIISCEIFRIENHWLDGSHTPPSQPFLTQGLILHCSVLYCTVLYCTVLYCTLLYCTVLYCTVLYCTVLYVLPQKITKYLLSSVRRGDEKTKYKNSNVYV